MKEAIRFGIVILVLMILGIVFHEQIGRAWHSARAKSSDESPKTRLVDRQDSPASRASEASQASDLSNAVGTGSNSGQSGTAAGARANALGDKIRQGDSDAP